MCKDVFRKEKGITDPPKNKRNIHSEWREALIFFAKENILLACIDKLVKDGNGAELCFGIPICHRCS